MTPAVVLNKPLRCTCIIDLLTSNRLNSTLQWFMSHGCFWFSHAQQSFSGFSLHLFLAPDAFVRSSRYCYDVHPSVCLSVWDGCRRTGVYCDHTVHFSANLTLRWNGWIVQCSGHPDTEACPTIPSRLFPVPPGKGGMDAQTGRRIKC